MGWIFHSFFLYCELCTAPHAPFLPSPAVVDKWGYLWSGGGTYIKDFGGATGRKHMVIRFNTEDFSMGFQYFPVDHETNVSAFDFAQQDPRC